MRTFLSQFCAIKHPTTGSYKRDVLWQVGFLLASLTHDFFAGGEKVGNSCEA